MSELFRVLIVDDHQEIRTVLRTALETLEGDLELIDVPSGEEAIIEVVGAGPASISRLRRHICVERCKPQAALGQPIGAAIALASRSSRDLATVFLQDRQLRRRKVPAKTLNT